MEFEFDKEMDSLMRQAAKGENLFTQQNPKSSHIDADEISMFAENALPEKARPRVMKHLADCDRCRIILSNLIVLNAEDEAKSAVFPVQENKAETVVSSSEPTWFQKLFATKNLAFGMGALALIFAVGIGFLVLQNSRNSENAIVAQANTNASSTSDDIASDNEVSKPSVEETANSNSAVTDANANISKTETDSKESVATGGETVSDPNLEPSDRKESPKETVQEKEVDETSVKNKPTTLGRSDDKRNKQGNDDAPSPTSDVIVTESRTTVAEDADKLKDAEEKPRLKNDGAIANSPAKPKAGPPITTRRAKKKSQERESSEAEKSLSSNSSTKRQISGRTFNRKDGVWYDSVYKNQKTTNVRRNTKDYNNLDSDLRSITDKLTGTVVVVWKSKAYRIQ